MPLIKVGVHADPAPELVQGHELHRTRVKTQIMSGNMFLYLVWLKIYHHFIFPYLEKQNAYFVPRSGIF